MTLHEFQSLRFWHLNQGQRHPVERHLWEAVLTIWLLGWVGGPAALLLGLGWAEIASLSALFLPGLYVALRRRLHNQRRLRCDWMIALK